LGRLQNRSGTARNRLDGPSAHSPVVVAGLADDEDEAAIDANLQQIGRSLRVKRMVGDVSTTKTIEERARGLVRA